MEEKILFESSKGLKLSGIISNPLKGSNRKIVILCHGLNSNKDNRANKLLTDLLNKQSIATFRFDFFGHGESEGDISDLTVSEAVQDLIKAIQLVKEKGYSKIGLMGSSFGGMASIIASTKVKGLSFLVLKSPVSDLKKTNIIGKDKKILEDWKKKGLRGYILPDGRKYSLKYSFFKDLENNKVYTVAKKVDIPTLVIHASTDKTVPVEQSIKLSKVIKNNLLEIIENADHSYTKKEHFEKAINTILYFILEKLI